MIHDSRPRKNRPYSNTIAGFGSKSCRGCSSESIYDQASRPELCSMCGTAFDWSFEDGVAKSFCDMVTGKRSKRSKAGQFFKSAGETRDRHPER